MDSVDEVQQAALLYRVLGRPSRGIGFIASDRTALAEFTSAACGLAAGAVAAFSAGGLRAHLRMTARKPAGIPAGYDNRLGHGILNLSDALA